MKPASNRMTSKRRGTVASKTKKYISSFCGIFKTTPGEKSAVQELLDDRAAERAREDRKLS